MRNGQSSATEVLGYAIDRREHYDEAGAFASAYYEIRCPRTGSVLGRAQSLRMAKRFVLMHELRDFDARPKQERTLREMFAA